MFQCKTVAISQRHILCRALSLRFVALYSLLYTCFIALYSCIAVISLYSFFIALYRSGAAPWPECILKGSYPGIGFRRFSVVVSVGFRRFPECFEFIIVSDATRSVVLFSIYSKGWYRIHPWNHLILSQTFPSLSTIPYIKPTKTYIYIYSI